MLIASAHLFDAITITSSAYEPIAGLPPALSAINMSAVYRMNSMGGRQLPCGTPVAADFSTLKDCPPWTQNCRLSRKLDSHRTRPPSSGELAIL